MLAVLEGIDDGLALKVMADGGPGLKAIVVEPDTVPDEAVIVTLLVRIVLEVIVTDACPPEVVALTAEMVPHSEALHETEKLIVVPSATGYPNGLCAMAVIVVCATPSAGMM